MRAAMAESEAAESASADQRSHSQQDPSTARQPDVADFTVRRQVQPGGPEGDPRVALNHRIGRLQTPVRRPRPSSRAWETYARTVILTRLHPNGRSFPARRRQGILARKPPRWRHAGDLK